MDFPALSISPDMVDFLTESLPGSNVDRKAGMYMSGNEIRIARKDEIGEIMELIAKCVQVMQDGGSDQWDDTYPNREVIGKDIADGTLYVCVDQAAIAGIIVLDENQAEQYEAIDWLEAKGPNLIMHRLAVHPEVQGKGIARKLIALPKLCPQRRLHQYRWIPMLRITGRWRCILL
jgi:GNAT superfamily N-acetyltransferase